MHWYQSAETDISLKWIDEVNQNSYTIPPFTMVTDYDNNVVYTLVGPSGGLAKGEFNVG